MAVTHVRDSTHTTSFRASGSFPRGAAGLAFSVIKAIRNLDWTRARAGFIVLTLIACCALRDSGRERKGGARASGLSARIHHYIGNDGVSRQSRAWAVARNRSASQSCTMLTRSVAPTLREILCT